MRTMSDTIARLAALRRQHGAHLPGEHAPDRLSTLTGFGSNPGGLTSRFYLPPNLPQGAPLVVVLHGCSQTAAAYDHRSGWSQLADEAGFALLYPEQHGGNNPNLCFNWFVPDDTRRDAGEVLSVRQMIETMVETHGLDRSRIFITGLSAGGAMAAAMLATYPEVFAGGGIIAGLPFGLATTVPEAFDLMRGAGSVSDEALGSLVREASAHPGPWPKIAIWHGSADMTVVPSNAETIAAQWRSAQDLDELPTQSDQSGGHSRRIWANTQGEAVIELNTIAAMGHGTPLSADLGVAGPYMLDVGISSTREIARFWGIASAQEPAVAGSVPLPVQEQPTAVSVPAVRTFGTDRPLDEAHPLDPRTTQSMPDVFGVQKTIETALRAAGLMR